MLSKTVWSVMTKQFTAKCRYGKNSHGEVSLRRIVLTAECPYGEVSSRQSVLTVTCPYDEESVRRSVRKAKCPYDEMSFGEKSGHGSKCS